MATLDDKLLGEKTHNYCSSSEEENDSDNEGNSHPKSGLKFVPESEEQSFQDTTHWSGNSTNTGPKGVIKDWQRFKQLETEKRCDQEIEKMALLKKLSISTRTNAEEEAAKEREDFDAELAELMNDDFLLQYQKRRMAEMLALAGKLPMFGQVFDLKNGEDFLNAIDEEQKSVVVVIHIYENNNNPCKIMNRELVKLAEEYANVKFCTIMSTVAGMSHMFKSSGIPALLVYKAGQVIGNFIRLTDDLGDDFYHSDIESFLIEHGMLPDKSSILN